MRFGMSTVKRMVSTVVVLFALVGAMGVSASAQTWRYRHERRVQRTRVYTYTTPRRYYYTTPRRYYYTTPRTYYYSPNAWQLRRVERRRHWRNRDRW